MLRSMFLATVLAVVGFGIGFAPCLDAQTSTAGDLGRYRATVRKLVSTSLTEGQAYEMLSELCRVAPKRLSGTPGAAAAVEWARQTMTRLGFENVRLDPCMVPHWERGRFETLEVISPPEGVGLKLPITALAPSVATGEDGLVAEVVEVKSIAALRALGEDAKGKIVFFNRPMDPRMIQTFQAYGGAVRQRSRGAGEVEKVGGVAAIVRSMTTLKDDHPHTGAMTPSKVPAAAVSTLGADRLSRLLKRHGKVKLRLRLDCRRYEDKQSYNVIGELRGREKPDEIVLVGGHLDAWDLAEGAHDDGAGCVQSIEVVRLLKSLELKPRRTIRVVLFMNEESGLFGARAYAKNHADELARHVMALESDRGGFTPRGFTTDANPKAMAILKDVVTLLSNTGGDRVVGGGGGADISVLRPAGTPLVGFLPDWHRYFDLHHSALDTFATVNERELELGAACMAALAYVVADLEEALPKNKVR